MRYTCQLEKEGGEGGGGREEGSWSMICIPLSFFRPGRPF